MKRLFTLKYGFLLALLLPALGGRAQKLHLSWTYESSDTAAVLQGGARGVYADSLALYDGITGLVDSLQAEGFLLAHLDSLGCTGDSCTARINTGPRFNWIELEAGALPEFLLTQAGFRQTEFAGRPLRYEQLRSLQKRLLEKAAENGYPLARIRLDSIRFQDGGGARARLHYESGPLLRYGALQLRGDAGIEPDVLQKLLHLPKGEVYKQKEATAISQNLKALPYLEESAPVQWLFMGEEAVPILQLRKRNASLFDFLFGLNSRSNPGGPRFSFTGQLRADFYNAFRHGERFQLQYEQLPSGTRKLAMRANYPYLGPLPIGASGQFEQFKQDSSFSNLLWRTGISYPLKTQQHISMYWQGGSSTLLQIDSAQIKQSRQLPEQLDVEERGLGLELALGRLDELFNPRKGWTGSLDISLLRKTIPKNPAITELQDDSQPDFDFETLYDSISTKSTQMRAQWALSWHLPLFELSSLKLGILSGHLLNRSSSEGDAPRAGIFRNELFQLGGYRDLRGFDERSLRASSFAVLTAEYRWLTGPDSRFYLFADYAWLEERSVAGNFTEHPLGLGAGLTFGTPAGQLAINLAFGKLQGQSFDWRNPKIHLGYVGRF
ncbi:MAG TPA: hypothetical protein ENJ88_06550 [Phaeodactylibacter sp.]|nr:hypothetical protein [Phaeodactylibacter sp.]